jgi:hypothetical protein
MSSFFTSDGRPVFRLGATNYGITSDGELVTGLPAVGAETADLTVTEDDDTLFGTFSHFSASPSTALTAAGLRVFGSGNAGPFLTSDGRMVQRIGTTNTGLASDGEMVFNLPAYISGSTVFTRSFIYASDRAGSRAESYF